MYYYYLWTCADLSIHHYCCREMLAKGLRKTRGSPEIHSTGRRRSVAYYILLDSKMKQNQDITSFQTNIRNWLLLSSSCARPGGRNASS